MRNLVFIIFFTTTFILGCSGSLPTVPDTGQFLDSDQVSLTSQNFETGGNIPWGYYNLEIARDGSSADVIPLRDVEQMPWGYHMNVAKFLEAGPCTNCLTTSNVHLLPNGDVSVDISIKHPFMDRRFTGFDVRGIIMFPASQTYPDNHLRELSGLQPLNTWRFRVANHEFGDAELMNPDGWTCAWAPEEGKSWDYDWYTDFLPEDYLDLQIFQYYPGQFASGENLSTLSAFKRFYTTEVRHMFEAGHTDTRKYIIRPPDSGPILASYAVYAHWSPADNIPVIDPETDFPPEANSPLPYEFVISQDAPLDQDAPLEVTLGQVHWHVKTWDIGPEFWRGSVAAFNLVGYGGGPLLPHPSGEPDDYYLENADYFTGYTQIPDAFPGTWTMICPFWTQDPGDPLRSLSVDVYLADFEYAPFDGEW